ncbi:MAG: ATP-binding cassette domain-containing protein [Christensenellaceae bacterium]|nr:ATP-binding cassette domain-containing protein [Christensenellaceae bacterium]
MIEVNGLYKSYGLNPAVKGISFKAEKGEIVGLVGRNGAGKSTTMNIISGYISSDEGTVQINGHDLLEEPVEAKRSLGYMPEFPPLYTEMTVYSYLEFVCKIMNVPKSEIKDHLKSIFNKTGLNEVKDRLIGNLSKGYRQRVGIAGALCGDPENIILDEPTSGLDPKQIVEIRQLIRSLKKNHAVIISSHILKELADICTRFVIIDRGRIVADDTLEGLLNKSSDGKMFELIVRGSADISPRISHIEGVSDVRRNEVSGGSRYLITVRNGADVSEALSRAATNGGVTVTMLRPVEYSLEDVFLELTEKAEEV